MSDVADSPDRPDLPDRSGRPVGRRVVLGLLGLGAVGVATGSAVQGWFDDHLGSAVRASGLGSVVPIDRWRYYTVTGSFPDPPRSGFRLRVSGLVDQPLDLTLDELEGLPTVQLTRDFQCVTGWRVPDVHWTGVRLRDLLDRAGVRTEGTALRFTSFDGDYTESLTLEQGLRDDVLVAHRMGNEPISREHGGPVRLVVAPMYGYKSVKWLDGVEVTERVRPGYWEVRGYDVDAWVGRSNGRTDPAT